jgi:two-component sensor histidine kinase
MPHKSAPLRRLGRKEVWGVPLLFFTGWMFALLSLLFDAVLLHSWSPFWILIFVATFGEVVVLGWIFRVQVLNRFNLDSVILNLIVAGMLGLIKNLTVAPLAIYFGLLDEPLWLFRMFGGFTLGAGVFVFAGLALGARTEHTAAMAQLTQVQKALLSLRTSSKARLSQANESLASQTRDLFVPKLDVLLGLVRAAGASGAVGATGAAVASLRKFIQEDVRPLSNELSSMTDQKLDSFEPTTKPYGSLKLFRPQVELRGLIKPNAAGISNALGALMLGYIILGAPRSNPGFYISGVSWALMWLVKLSIPAGVQVSRRAAIWILFALGTAMFIPIYLMELLEVESAVEPWLLLVIWPSSLVSLMSFAFSESLDRDRVALRKALQKDNKALAHDQALFEQQLWLGRRAWQFVVHGTVQSALTAALTRLQSAPEPEKYILNRVAEDLERARTALTQTPEREIDLPDSIAQLKATWRGICEIQTQITERATRALQRNNDACLCVNEIIKEAVSNAVRHGEAQKITIQIDRHDDFNLEILVSNDGLPLRDQRQLGVGSRLIEELTTDWSLTSSKASGLTVFKANLPLQRV